MLHDSILGVELLLRQFQNIFAWWMKWKNLDSLSCVKLWNYLDFGQFALCCVKNLHKLFMWIKWWNLEHYCRFWVNKFLHKLFMWANLDHYCLHKFLHKFWVNRLFMWANLDHYYLHKFFVQVLSEQIVYVSQFGSLLFGWADFFYKVFVEHIFYIKKNRIFNVSNRTNRLNQADRTAPL